MLFPRFLLCFLACVWTSCLAANPETPPRLVFLDGKNTFPIEGYETTSQKTRLLYFDGSGNKQYLDSLSGIRIEGSSGSIHSFTTLAKFYALTQMQPETGLTLRAQNIDLPTERDSKLSNDVIYTLAWIHKKGAEILYANSQLNTLYDLSIPNVGDRAFGDKIDGYIAILAFEKGIAFLPSFESQTGDDAILNAALNGLSEYLATELGEKVDFQKFPFNGILMAAAQTGRSECIQIILDFFTSLREGPKRVAKNLPKSPGSYLRVAIDRKHAHSLHVLANHPYFAPSKSKEKDIVSYALQSHQFEMADVLLASGFPLSTNLDNRLAVILNALQANRIDIVEAIRKQDGFKPETLKLNTAKTVYHHVASSANVETLEYLDQFDIPIDRADRDLYTPLILAAGYGNIPAVCWFLEKGARIDHRNDHGHTALQYSIIKQQEEATHCLLDMGSDVNLPGPEGVTPLMQAALFRDVDGAHSILQRGGMWNLDSPYLAPCLQLTIQQDLADLLDLAFIQGLPRDYSLFEKYPLPWLAQFYDSQNCKRLFPDTAFETLAARGDAHITIRAVSNGRVGSVSKTLRDAAPFSFTCLLGNTGRARLIQIDSESVDRFQEVELQRQIQGITFSGTILDQLEAHEGLAADLTLGLAPEPAAPTLEVVVNAARQIDIPNIPAFPQKGHSDLSDDT